MGPSKSSRNSSCIKVVAGRGQEARMPIRCYQTLRSAASVALFENYRKVVTLECFIERATTGHLRAAYRPSMPNPASKKLARHLIHGHACDVSGPA